MSNQLATYDFTIPMDRMAVEQVKAKLHGWAKKWVFQGERGDTGYEHWQGRLSLIKKRRIDELVAQMGPQFPGIHLSPTSSTVHRGSDFNYVMKEDTRISGPWKDTEYQEPAPFTRQLRRFLEMEKRPWQIKIREMAQRQDDRRVTLIIDKKGDSGKSVTSEWLEYDGIGYEIPPMNSMEDLMQCCMGIPPQQCYIVDMPRGMKKGKLSEFYSGIESLKNGTMYDKRYAFKKRRIDRPQIIVFTNTEPDYELMSKDRWEVWEMTRDYDIVQKEITFEIQDEEDE